MKKYKYDSPYDWLDSASRYWDANALRNATLLLAEKVDPDDIQDIFQQEMDEDGYFDEIT